MPTSRAIKGLLRNFLETYSSRNADFGGYWLFGLILNDLDVLEVNLLANQTKPSGSPMVAAETIAIEKFRNQTNKAGFDLPDFREAGLCITRQQGTGEGLANGGRSNGQMILLKCRVLTNGGKTFEDEQLIFVAPHDPKRESQSVRAKQGIE
jgi:hypothetical protein